MTAQKKSSKPNHGPGPKPKKQEDRSILINVVLDKSGSMDVIRQATISGFNEFLGDQQREGGSARITLTLFDTQFHTVATAVPVAELSPLDLSTYRPSGCTALYDAIGYTLKATDDYVARSKPDQVLFVIMTDGEENSSREFTREQIFKLIEDRQQNAQYEFIYLGANQDAYVVGRSIGVKGDRTLSYDATPHAAAATMTRVSHNVKAHRRSGLAMAEDASWFSAEFEAAGAPEWAEHKAKRDAEEGQGDVS